jgi:hypothetical protein
VQRNWKPVLISNDRANDGKVDEGERISHAAQSNGAPANDDGRTDIRFAIGAALAVGLPALIGAGLYLAVTAVLRLS